MFSRRMAFLLLTAAAGCQDTPMQQQMLPPMCKTGQRLCSGVCVDVLSDPVNCGQCGRPCDQGQVCSMGVCQQNCPVGLTQCDRSCIDTKVDHSHCGDCKTECLDMEVCSQGACSIACQQPLTNCNGVCVDLQTDPRHCNACDMACPPQNACIQGVCTPDCQAPLINCHDMCVDPRWDPDNCSNCDKVCVPPANMVRYCQASVCQHGGCLMGFEDCNNDRMDGCEVQLDSDVDNCGGCFNACPRPQNITFRCAQGMCMPGDCDVDYADCNGDPYNDGCEVSLQTDVNNCGKCGNVCVAPKNVQVTCEMGLCKLGACVQGFTDCDMNMMNGCEASVNSDVNNCGQCGNVCPMNTPYCINGKCTAAQIFTANFTQFADGQANCGPWNTYRASLLGNTYNSVNIKGSLDQVGVTCNNTGANEPGQIAQALRNGQAFSLFCNGRTWQIGTCGAGISFSGSGGQCACQTPGYTMRPCINVGNPNWGGANSATCSGPTQTITITFN